MTHEAIGGRSQPEPRRGALIVDADPARRDGVARLLRDRGYAVGEAIDGASALTQVNETSRDLLIINWDLPDEDGLTLCRRLHNHARCRGIPIFLITTAVSPARNAQAIKAGALDLLPRSMSPQDLLLRALPYLELARTRRQLHAQTAALAAQSEAMRKAQQSAGRFSRVLERSLNEIYTLDAETLLFLDVNRGARVNLGYSSDELAQMTPLDIKKTITRPEFDRLIEPLRTGKQARVVFETTHHRKDGSTYPVEVRLELMSEPPAVFVAVVQDTTERRWLEAERERLEQRHHQSQRLESVGRLAGGIAHDFNNLLTVINGYAQMGAKSLPQGDPLKDDLEQIIDAGTRAAGLTSQLLAFSRRQRMEPRTIDINLVVHDMERMLQRLIGENIEFTVRPCPKPALVSADPGQIEQVIMNLAINARDAMSSGGRLEIQTRTVTLLEDPGRASLDTSPGPYVVLSVADNGTGMSSEVLEHLFEPFFSTKDSGRGTGLGLSTVYGIVKQSGGAIEVQSRRGDGARFEVFLPQVQGEITGDTSGSDSPQRASGETLLVVEDERPVRLLTARILRAAGYSLIVAENGARALEAVWAHPGSVDLVLSDVLMPQMSGPELVERLRAERPAMRVVFMSGYPSDALGDDEAQSVGGVRPRFIAKPFTSGSLLRAIRDALDAPKGAD